MPWIGDEWFEDNDSRREVDGDHVGQPRPTGVLGPGGQQIHRLEPVVFGGKSRLVYVRKRDSVG